MSLAGVVSVLSHWFSSFGSASNEPFWRKTRLLFFLLARKPDLFTDFLKVKGALLSLIAAFSLCLRSLDEALCATRQLTSGNKHWSKEDNPFPLPVISILSTHPSTKQPSAPFITGFVLTQLSFWPHLPQPGSEISGSGI